MATAPTPGANRARPEPKPTFTIVIRNDLTGDVRYPVWFDEASARDVNDLRLGGYARGGLMALQRAMADGDIDLPDVAALVWLSRRQRGEANLKYGAVLPTITYSTDFLLEYDEDDVDPDPEDDSPEA